VTRSQQVVRGGKSRQEWLTREEGEGERVVLWGLELRVVRAARCLVVVCGDESGRTGDRTSTDSGIRLGRCGVSRGNKGCTRDGLTVRIDW
jgi:hypothetical protein